PGPALQSSANSDSGIGGCGGTARSRDTATSRMQDGQQPPYWTVENEVCLSEPMDACTAASLGDCEYLDQAVTDGRLPAAALGKANRSGWTPLMYAAYLGHDSLVKLLLEKYGTHVGDTADKRRRTALMLACSCGHRSAVTILATASYSGPDPDPIDSDGHNAAMHCVLFGQRDCLEDLLLCWQRKRSLCGLLHLRQAVLGGHTATTQLLLEKLFCGELLELAGFSINQQPASIEAVFSELKLNKYAHLFEGMPMQDFLQLTEEQIVARGLTLIGPKRKLVNHLTQLRANQPAPTPAVEAEQPQPRQASSADRADSIQQAKDCVKLLEDICINLTDELGKSTQPANVQIWLHKLRKKTVELQTHLERVSNT
ncbi:hypothetical protein BOX15_Mlig016491g4, partial [Macrostomum lignano]